MVKKQKLRESVHSDDNIELRKFLIEKRKNLNLSQRQLAEKLNIHYSVVGKIETGDKRMDFLELRRYAKALNFIISEVEELFNLADSNIHNNK